MNQKNKHNILMIVIITITVLILVIMNITTAMTIVLITVAEIIQGETCYIEGFGDDEKIERVALDMLLQ